MHTTFPSKHSTQAQVPAQPASRRGWFHPCCHRHQTGNASTLCRCNNCGHTPEASIYLVPMVPDLWDLTMRKGSPHSRTQHLAFSLPTCFCAALQRAHPQRLQRAFGRGFVVVFDDPETVLALRLSPTVFFSFTVSLGLGKSFTKPSLPPHSTLTPSAR